ncbi:MAG: CDP-diacylglycerol--glycerol-3-phosphate 3-phosphatidyltransferase [Verrucomicrobiales bacterium]
MPGIFEANQENRANLEKAGFCRGNLSQQLLAPVESRSLTRTMNLPNQLTVFRLILTGVFVVVMSAGLPYLLEYEYSIGFIIFAVASITDFLDGYLARRFQQVTNFGKLMDPLADKILIAAGFIVLVDIQMVWAWAVIVILSREFLVTGIRLIASSQGKVVAADRLGKHKTIWQIATVLFFLLDMARFEPLFAWTSPFYEWNVYLDFKIAGSVIGKIDMHYVIGFVLISMSVLLTVLSGLFYAVKNWHLLREEEA